MKIDICTNVQNNSPFYSNQSTSKGKKGNGMFQLDLSESSAASAGNAEITGLMEAIDEKITEMKEKIKNGEVQEKFQTGSTSFTNEEWERLITKFDASEDSLKKATLENSENTNEIKQEQAAAESQTVQQPSENTGIDIVAHLYKQHKGHFNFNS